MGILLIVLQLLPSIIETITAIEKAFPGPGLGEAKKDLIIDVIKDSGGDSKELISSITKVIDLVVTVLNKLGVFKTSTPILEVGK